MTCTIAPIEGEKAMSYYSDWEKLMDDQTDTTVSDFWEKYSDAEIRIYTTILTDGCKPVKGTFEALRTRYDVDPILFMGFLDGINTSIQTSLTLEEITDETSIELQIDPEALYLNMHKADAPHLYELEAWSNVLDETRRGEIAQAYKRSKTIHKEKTPGRNDPCSCGSGKKYKKCCGA
jgi:hypothetical protein